MKFKKNLARLTIFPMLKRIWNLFVAIAIATSLFLGTAPAPAMAQPTIDGSVLPFPPVPSASVANPTLQESTNPEMLN